MWEHRNKLDGKAKEVVQCRGEVATAAGEAAQAVGAAEGTEGTLREARGRLERLRGEVTQQSSQGAVVKALLAAKASGDLPGVHGRLGTAQLPVAPAAVAAVPEPAVGAGWYSAAVVYGRLVLAAAICAACRHLHAHLQPSAQGWASSRAELAACHTVTSQRRQSCCAQPCLHSASDMHVLLLC